MTTSSSSEVVMTSNFLILWTILKTQSFMLDGGKCAEIMCATTLHCQHSAVRTDCCDTLLLSLTLTYHACRTFAMHNYGQRGFRSTNRKFVTGMNVGMGLCWSSMSRTSYSGMPPSCTLELRCENPRKVGHTQRLCERSQILPQSN